MTTPIHPASSQGGPSPLSSVAAHGGEKGQHLTNMRAMPSARAADASHSSLLRVSTGGGIAIAAFAALYFSGELLRAYHIAKDAFAVLGLLWIGLTIFCAVSDTIKSKCDE